DRGGSRRRQGGRDDAGRRRRARAGGQLHGVRSAAHLRSRPDRRGGQPRGLDPGSSITQGSSPWPDLQFGVPASNTTPFAASLSAAADCGVNLDFALRLHSDQGDAVVPFTVPTGRAGPARPFDSADVPKPINDNASVTSSFDVPTPGRVKGLRVRIPRINHTYVGDLRIELIGPDDTKVRLFDQRGESGDNLVDTVFDSSAPTPISAGSAPFTGTFRPEESLHLFDGREQQGTWTLKVTDLRAPDTG